MTDDSGKSDPRNRRPGKAGGDDFDEYLGGHSRVSETYKALGDENPPADLDARILAEARKASSVRSLVVPNRRRAWAVPLAVAATILLSFPLVMIVVTETEKSPSVRKSAEFARSPAPALEEQAIAPADTLTSGRLEVFSADTPRELDELKAEQGAEQREAAMAGESPARARYPAAKTMSNQPMAFSPPSADLDAAIDTIRAYLDPEMSSRASGRQLGAANLMTEAEVSRDVTGKSSDAAGRKKKDQLTDPEGQLEEILTLYDSSQSDAADAAIREFRDSYPDHPVSALLLERGY